LGLSKQQSGDSTFHTRLLLPFQRSVAIARAATHRVIPTAVSVVFINWPQSFPYRMFIFVFVLLDIFPLVGFRAYSVDIYLVEKPCDKVMMIRHNKCDNIIIGLLT